VIVPLPSVVVVVVEVSVTWAHANGAATANAILSTSFFITEFGRGDGVTYSGQNVFLGTSWKKTAAQRRRDSLAQ
jgi:hypothetical protein